MEGLQPGRHAGNETMLERNFNKKTNLQQLEGAPTQATSVFRILSQRIASWSMYVKVAEMYMKAAATGVLGQLTAAAQQQWDALDPSLTPCAQHKMLMQRSHSHSCPEAARGQSTHLQGERNEGSANRLQHHHLQERTASLQRKRIRFIYSPVQKLFPC